jgi:hypothetical protein
MLSQPAGLTVTVQVKVGLENAGTRAVMSLDRIHPSAGWPAAEPVTATACTLPSDWNVTVAWEIGSSGPKQ